MPSINVILENVSPTIYTPYVQNSNFNYNLHEDTSQTLPTINKKTINSNLSNDSIGILHDSINKLKIVPSLAASLFKLSIYNIFFIIDDSQSMMIKDTQLYEENSVLQLTRMEELKIRLKSIAPLISAVAKCDINIRILSNVETNIVLKAGLSVEEKLTHFNDIIDSLQPTAKTPLIKAVTKTALLVEKFYYKDKTNSVVYIFTGSIPNDNHIKTGKSGVDGLLEALYRMPILKKGAMSIGISACTEDDNFIGWLERLDKNPYIGDAINVQDNFFSEAQKIYFSQGKTVPFSNYGFYLVIGLLSPIIGWIDKLNEQKNLTIEELVVLTGKQITAQAYQGYITSASEARKEQWYNDYLYWIYSSYKNNDFELEIIDIDGKKYKKKLYLNNNAYSATDNENKNVLSQMTNCTIL